MANKLKHEAQGQHNETLRKSIPDTHPDWEITVMFYATLHYLRAVLASRGERYTGDDLRYDMLSHYLRLEGEEALIDPFEELRDLSYSTRYKCRDSSWAYSRMTLAETAFNLIKRRVSILGIKVL